MTSPITPSAFLTGSGYATLAVASLVLSLLLGAALWRRDHERKGQDLVLSAGALLFALGLRWPFARLAEALATEPAAWAAPLDRITAALALAALGLLLLPRLSLRRAGGMGLGAALVVLGSFWVASAPAWAASVGAGRARPAQAQAWDLVLAIAAAALCVQLLRRGPGAPRWPAGLAGLLGLGLLVDAWWMPSTAAALGLRAGFLAGCGLLLGLAFTARRRASSSAAGEAARRLHRVLRAGRREQDPGGDADSLVAAEALEAMTSRLGASPAVVCLRRGEDLDLWSLGAESRARRIATLPLADQPTLRRTLLHGRQELKAGYVARDVDRIYAQLGLPDAGPVLLERIGTRRAYGVLLAGRAYRAWQDEEREGLSRIADRAAALLEALAARGVRAEHDAPRAYLPDASLLSAIADALRSPITSLRAFDELVTRGPRVPEHEMQRHFATFDANLRRLDVLLDDLCTVLDLEGVAERSPDGPADIEAVVDRSVGRARTQFDEKGIQVRTEVQRALPAASSDGAIVARILDNLLFHAAARSPHGAEVEVEARRLDDDVLLSVLFRAPFGGAARPASPPELRIASLLAERQGGEAWHEGDDGRQRLLVRLPLETAA